MQNIIKALIGLAIVAFILAIIATLFGRIVGVPAEAFSRACTNLTLIAIALFVLQKKDKDDKQG